MDRVQVHAERLRRLHVDRIGGQALARGHGLGPHPCALEKGQWASLGTQAPSNPLAPVWLQRVLPLILRCSHVPAMGVEAALQKSNEPPNGDLNSAEPVPEGATAPSPCLPPEGGVSPAGSQSRQQLSPHPPWSALLKPKSSKYRPEEDIKALGAKKQIN